MPAPAYAIQASRREELQKLIKLLGFCPVLDVHKTVQRGGVLCIDEDELVKELHKRDPQFNVKVELLMDYVVRKWGKRAGKYLEILT